MARALAVFAFLLFLAGPTRGLITKAGESVVPPQLALAGVLDTGDESEDSEEDTEGTEDSDKENPDDDKKSDDTGSGDKRDKGGDSKSSTSKKGASEDAKSSRKQGAEDKEDKNATDSEEKADKNESDSKPKASDEAAKGETSGEKRSLLKSDASSGSKKADVHIVEAKELKIEVALDGVLVTPEMKEVALRPKVWSSFKVVEAVPHGDRVRKGDILVKFEDKDIEQAISEKSLQERLDELALLKAEEEFPRRKKTIALQYEIAKRSYEQSVDEYERFQKTMRDLSEKIAEYNLRAAKQELDNAREELDQLEKMYTADELTEETEEIVLRRQKFQVEMAEVYVEYSQVNHEYMMNVSIPRREELLTTAIEQAKLSFEDAKMDKSIGVSKEQYEMQALRERRERAVEKHSELVADRELMVLRAPRDGLAYYGRQIDGRWIEVGSMESRLIPFGSVTPNSIVFTIVDETPAYLDASVGEKEFTSLKASQAATVIPVADTDVELPATVKKIANVPGSGNKFKVRLELNAEADCPEWLKPGMTAKAKVVAYQVDDAVVLPADLVQSDEDDPKQKYVMLQLDGEKEPLRRDIKLGKAKDKLVEVTKGLKAGDKVLKGVKYTKPGADDEAASEGSDKKDSGKKAKETDEATSDDSNASKPGENKDADEKE